MRIVEDFDPEGVLLSEVEYGGLFSYQSSYFMKCEDSNNLMNWKEENREDIPVVDMSTGIIFWVNRNVKVPPIYARIRINGRAD